MFDLFDEIWGSLMRNKMRTVATGIAVASGIFLLIVLLGASNGIIHTLEQNSQNLALDAIHVWPGFTSKPFNGHKEGRSINIESSDQRMADELFSDRISSTSAVVERNSTASVGQRHMSVNIRGVYPSLPEVEQIKLVRGRFVNTIDLHEKRRVAIIDEQMEEHLFKAHRSGLGRYINVDGFAYRVVGIVAKDLSYGSNEFIAPYTTVSTIYGSGKNIDQLTLKARGLDTEEKNQQFEQDFRTALAARHEFDRTDRSAIWIWNSAEDNASMNKAERILHTAFWILGLLTLLSGVVGVSNIMLIAVKERTHEFGIRRAIGARPASIIRMVILESVLITTAFGYTGMLLGIAFCQWMDASVGNTTIDLGFIQQKVFLDPTVDLATCLQATVVMVVAGALAGFFPAQRAARIKPIEALRG